jgi:hypothetical protein
MLNEQTPMQAGGHSMVFPGPAADLRAGNNVGVIAIHCVWMTAVARVSVAGWLTCGYCKWSLLVALA